MKKGIFLIALFFISAACICLSGDNNLIYWSAARKLTWKDFKGTPVSGQPEYAVTHYDLSYSLNALSSSLRIVVKSDFNELASWTKDTADKFLLMHEQGHFNLAELYARKIRKALLGTRFTYDSAGAQFKKVYKGYFHKLNKEQDIYDSITNHSRNHAEQTIWSDKIYSEIHALDVYKDTVLQVKIY